MVFSVPSFISAGDDFDKKKVVDQRSSGKSFVAVSGKRGTGPDALFDKEFKSINEGDPFVNPGAAERRARIEVEKKKVGGTFRMTNPPKKAVGLGGYFGTFQDKPTPHETDYVVPRKGDAVQRKTAQPRQVYTAPTSKGGYGQPHMAMSGIGADYVADFYDAGREAERKRQVAHKAAIKGAPFRGGSRPGATFDEALGTGTSKCYTMTKAMPPRKMFESKVAGKGPDASWRPSGVIPKKLPAIDYREDPFGGKDPRESGKKPKKVDNDKGSWKPASNTNDTWYTKSIAFARL